MRNIKHPAAFLFLPLTIIIILLITIPVFAAPTRTENPEIIYDDDDESLGRSNIPLTLVSSTVLDGGRDIPLNPLIQLDFNKNVVNISVNQNNLASYHLADENGNHIAIDVTLPDDQLQSDVKRSVFISPQENLLPESYYILVIDNTLKAKNGTYIDTAYRISFVTGSETQVQSNELLDSLGGNIVTYGSDFPLNENSVSGQRQESALTLQTPLLSSEPTSSPINAETLSKIIIAIAILSLILIIFIKIRKRHQV